MSPTLSPLPGLRGIAYHSTPRTIHVAPSFFPYFWRRTALSKAGSGPSSSTKTSCPARFSMKILSRIFTDHAARPASPVRTSDFDSAVLPLDVITTGVSRASPSMSA